MLGKAKKLLAAAIITAAPLFTLLAPGIAHAATFTCTWTGLGADDNFSTILNWSGCNGSAPDPTNDTDDLVFPVSAPRLSPVNDLTAATFNSVTFNGSGSGGYNITGNDFTLAGDVADSSGQPNTIGTNVAISGTSHVTVTNASSLVFAGTVSGAGSIISDAGATTFDDLTLTGALTVNAGTLAVVAQSSADATVSGVTVASGATFAYDAFTNSGVTTYGLSTPITTAGTLDFQGGSAGTQTLNLTGTITLTGNSNIVVSNATTVHIQGSLVGPGFKVTAASTGIAFNESTSNTSDTPTGDVMGASTTAPPPATTTPTTPDTGFAFAAAHPVVTLALTTLLAGSIFGIAQVNRKLAARR